jgi:hypothetical protein
MKRIVLLFAVIFVFSVAAHTQTITVTLSGNQSGWLNCPELNVSTQCWYRATDTTPGLSGRPWLVNGVYSAQVTRSNRGADVIVIFGGPNNIGKERGIFIHIGNSPSDSDGCIVIGGNQLGGAFRTLYSGLECTYGRDGRVFTVHVTR